MALSQIQCLDDNHVNLRTHESKPEFLYCEEQRHALESFLREGLEEFEKYLRAHGVRGFLSNLELERMSGALEPYNPGSEPYQADSDSDEPPLSLQYWPDLSDCSFPQLDLGWPDCVSYRGVTRVNVIAQPPMDGQAHIKEIIRKTIAQAQKVIAVVMDVFTDVDIFRDLLDAGFKRKVSVYILLERTSLPHFLSMCERADMHKGHLKSLRVCVTGGVEFHTRSCTKVPGRLGHRFMFVDGDRSYSGSYSFTWTASRLDKHLITVVTGQAVEAFDRLFRDLYVTSCAVSLHKVATGIEPQPEPLPPAAPVAPPSAEVARKLINPKYALVTASNSCPTSSSNQNIGKNSNSQNPALPESRKQRSKAIKQEAEDPPLHPGLAHLEKAYLIPYLPVWPEPDPPSDVIGFINVRDASRPTHVHLQRSERFETSQAIRFSSPLAVPKETLPEVAQLRRLSITPPEHDTNPNPKPTEPKSTPCQGHAAQPSPGADPRPGPVAHTQVKETHTPNTEHNVTAKRLSNTQIPQPMSDLNAQTCTDSSHGELNRRSQTHTHPPQPSTNVIPPLSSSNHNSTPSVPSPPLSTPSIPSSTLPAPPVPKPRTVQLVISNSLDYQEVRVVPRTAPHTSIATLGTSGPVPETSKPTTVTSGPVLETSKPTPVTSGQEPETNKVTTDPSIPVPETSKTTPVTSGHVPETSQTTSGPVPEICKPTPDTSGPVCRKPPPRTSGPVSTTSTPTPGITGPVPETSKPTKVIVGPVPEISEPKPATSGPLPSKPSPGTSGPVPQTCIPTTATSRPVSETSKPTPVTSGHVPETETTPANSGPVSTKPSPGPSGQVTHTSTPTPGTSGPVPETCRSTAATSGPVSETSKPTPATSGPLPSKPSPGTSGPVTETCKPTPATSRPLPSKPSPGTSGPVTETCTPTPGTSGPVSIKPLPGTSGPVPEPSKPTTGTSGPETSRPTPGSSGPVSSKPSPCTSAPVTETCRLTTGTSGPVPHTSKPTPANSGPLPSKPSPGTSGPVTSKPSPATSGPLPSKPSPAISGPLPRKPSPGTSGPLPSKTSPGTSGPAPDTRGEKEEKEVETSHTLKQTDTETRTTQPQKDTTHPTAGKTTNDTRASPKTICATTQQAKTETAQVTSKTIKGLQKDAEIKLQPQLGSLSVNKGQAARETQTTTLQCESGTTAPQREGTMAAAPPRGREDTVTPQSACPAKAAQQRDSPGTASSAAPQAVLTETTTVVSMPTDAASTSHTTERAVDSATREPATAGSTPPLQRQSEVTTVTPGGQDGGPTCHAADRARTRDAHATHTPVVEPGADTRGETGPSEITLGAACPAAELSRRTAPTPESPTLTPEPRMLSPAFRSCTCTPVSDDSPPSSLRADSNLSTTSEEYFECSGSPLPETTFDPGSNDYYSAWWEEEKGCDARYSSATIVQGDSNTKDSSHSSATDLQTNISAAQAKTMAMPKDSGTTNTNTSPDRSLTQTNTEDRPRESGTAFKHDHLLIDANDTNTNCYDTLSDTCITHTPTLATAKTVVFAAGQAVNQPPHPNSNVVPEPTTSSLATGRTTPTTLTSTTGCTNPTTLTRATGCTNPTTLTSATGCTNPTTLTSATGRTTPTTLTSATGRTTPTTITSATDRTTPTTITSATGRTTPTTLSPANGHTTPGSTALSPTLLFFTPATSPTSTPSPDPSTEAPWPASPPSSPGRPAAATPVLPSAEGERREDGEEEQRRNTESEGRGQERPNQERPVGQPFKEVPGSILAPEKKRGPEEGGPEEDLSLNGEGATETLAALGPSDLERRTAGQQASRGTEGKKPLRAPPKPPVRGLHQLLQDSQTETPGRRPQSRAPSPGRTSRPHRPGPPNPSPQQGARALGPGKSRPPLGSFQSLERTESPRRPLTRRAPPVPGRRLTEGLGGRAGGQNIPLYPKTPMAFHHTLSNPQARLYPQPFLSSYPQGQASSLGKAPFGLSFSRLYQLKGLKDRMDTHQPLRRTTSNPSPTQDAKNPD